MQRNNSTTEKLSSLNPLKVSSLSKFFYFLPYLEGRVHAVASLRKY